MTELRTRAIPEILRDIVDDLCGIIRSEVRLVKAEARHKGSEASRAAKIAAIGAVLVLYAGGLILLSAVWALALVVPAWASALITAVVVAVPGAILMHSGSAKLRDVLSEKETVSGTRN